MFLHKTLSEYIAWEMVMPGAFRCRQLFPENSVLFKFRFEGFYHITLTILGNHLYILLKLYVSLLCNLVYLIF